MKATGVTGTHYPPVQDVSVRRWHAGYALDAFRRSGRDKFLELYVRMVGEGGTFPTDFPVVSFEPMGGRDALKPRCWRCRQRKPLASYRSDKHALHGHSPWCKTCEREREDGAVDGRTWHRNPTGVKRKVIPIDEPVTFVKTCECCGRQYETVHHDQRYCRRQCRWAMNKRNHRARKAA